ncbi:conserved exported protein of unknown function [Rhodovastum atsumiense]|uniref:Tetratricopeptide repeat protein n=1 Tax=Rhodovastum atsumiense TaxID=504468 RepID=A0A5M6IJK1_9PROT|nr:tetratricopeptide repeat protein [Rhodovastum atsumiense]KAA5608444.1 hypothetical protein F1189_29000 [Rhodovastum atsumiense]CAH2604655.1 conserved exported protein of unknown function [Rhodovastum atsumiense]
MKHVLAAVLLVAFALVASVPAYAQFDSREAIGLNNQIAELRRDLQMLREQVARGGGGGGAAAAPSSLGSRGSLPPSGASSDLLAQLLDRVSNLEDEVRRLRGRVDEGDNARQRMGEDLSKQIGDLAFRVDGMSSGGASRPGAPAAPAAPAAASPAAPAPAATATPRRTPELVLQEGNAALARRDYATAEQAAREVLSGPRTPRSIDANFLLAQSLAGRRDWAKAAVAYDDTYNRSRTGSRAQDSLLGLATALSNLGEKRAACETLGKLTSEFPSPRPEVRKGISDTRQSAGCR